MLIGSVVTEVISASTSGRPTIVTYAGSTPISSSAKPGAGAPVSMFGRTATVVSVSTARTSIWTETISGSTSSWPAPTGCPAMSTRVSGTGSFTLIPDAGISTVATARSTWLTTDAGPRTSTVSALTTGSSISRPSGIVPRSTSTDTERTSMRSTSTRTSSGTTERISTPSFRLRHSSGSCCGSGARSRS